MDNAIRHMTENKELLGRLQERAALQKQFMYASDDPLAAGMSFSLRSSLSTTQVYLDVTMQSKDWLSAAEVAFQQMDNVGLQISNLAVRGLSDTLSAAERIALANDAAGLMEQALQAGNAAHNGQFLFSGFQVDAPAFSITNTGAISYDGDQGTLKRNIGPGQTLVINVPGDQAFLDFFNNIASVRDALQNNNKTALQAGLDALKSTMDTVGKFHTANGTRLKQAQQAIDFLERTQIETKSLLSQNEDANLAERISLLRSQETTFQAVLEVSQRAVSTMSLFDFLR